MKVLIVSHLPMATQNNMGKTFLSLFSQFEREDLCQLYIYPAVPDVDRCSSYFRVTDKEVLLSFLGKRKIGCEIDHNLIHGDQGLYEHAEDESFYRSRKNKSAIRRLLRDAMWAMSPWYGKSLRQWLDREQPDCIFVAPGAAKFLYNIALRIARNRKIPVIPYVCDEYYFVQEPDGLLEKLRLDLLKRKIRQLMAESRHLVVISEELKQEYQQEFAIETSVVMTGASIPVSEQIHLVQYPTEISYFGNIRCNRYVGLAEVGRVLDKINRERNGGYRLKIYTSEKDPGILAAFDGIHSVQLCGFITGQAYKEAFSSARMLLHVEAFDEASVDFTKHSVSTKIADSLASGIPLLAYGPEGISSMRHLCRNHCAVVAVSEDGLEQMLLAAFNNVQVRETAAWNGLLTARDNHETKISGLKMKEIVSEVLGYFYSEKEVNRGEDLAGQ